MSQLISQQILPRCVNPAGISTETAWYYPIVATNFPVCSYCYAKHIESSELAKYFKATWRSADSSRRCQWNTPRVTFYQEAGDWDAIKRFMVQRAKLPQCQGATGHTGPDGSRWYTLLDPSVVSNMVICEICYEDLIAWNGLRKFFSTAPFTKTSEGVCTCDTTVPLIRDGLKLNARSLQLDDDWNELLPFIKRRMELPSCQEMRQLPAGRTDWYSSMAVPRLLVCGACYLDTFGLDYGNFWNLLSFTAEQEELHLECAMSTMPIQIAWRNFELKETHDFKLFEDHAKVILESPQCTSEGIKDVVWYTPRTYLGSEFAICGRCVAAFMIPPGFRSYFRELSPPEDGSAYICDFNPVKPRFLIYMAKYDEAVAQEDLEVLSSFVSRYAALPDCPKSEGCKNRKWYGTEYFTVCELCYEDFVKATSLASRLEYDTVAEEMQCHLYSARMRKLWLQACEENNLEAFEAVAQERMRVLKFAQNEIFQIRMRQTRLQNEQMRLFMASIQNQGIEGMSTAVGQRPTYEYGNSLVGWGYATRFGAEAAMQFQQALAIHPQQPEDVVKLAHLNAMWAEVE